MKKKLHYLLGLALMSTLAACEFDNYEAPKSTLQGRIVYKGEPINVEYNNVGFELWEPGWQKRVPIGVLVDQDGSYSAMLFDATYKLVIPPAQGPFKAIRKDNSDTTIVNVRGSQQLDIEVLPYYMVRNSQFSANSRKVTASCKLEQIATGADAKNVERVSLYVSKTQFVDARTSVTSVEVKGSDIKDLNAVALNLDVPALTPSQSYVYARIGVKIEGVEDLIFSPVQKVQL